MALGLFGKFANKAKQSFKKPIDKDLENDLARAKSFESEQAFRNKKGLKDENFFKPNKTDLAVMGGLGVSEYATSENAPIANALLSAAQGYALMRGGRIAVDAALPKMKNLASNAKNVITAGNATRLLANPYTAAVAGLAAVGTDAYNVYANNKPSVLKNTWDWFKAAGKRAYHDDDEDGQHLDEMQKATSNIYKAMGWNHNTTDLEAANEIYDARQRGEISNKQAMRAANILNKEGGIEGLNALSDIKRNGDYIENQLAQAETETPENVEENNQQQGLRKNQPIEITRYAANETPQTILDNPNNPSLWQVNQGEGLIRMQDGRVVRVNNPNYDPDIVRAQEIEDAERQYYLNQMSIANSRLYPPSMRAQANENIIGMHRNRMMQQASLREAQKYALEQEQAMIQNQQKNLNVGLRELDNYIDNNFARDFNGVVTPKRVADLKTRIRGDSKLQLELMAAAGNPVLTNKIIANQFEVMDVQDVLNQATGSSNPGEIIVTKKKPWWRVWSDGQRYYVRTMSGDDVEIPTNGFSKANFSVLDKMVAETKKRTNMEQR